MAQNSPPRFVIEVIAVTYKLGEAVNVGFGLVGFPQFTMDTPTTSPDGRTVQHIPISCVNVRQIKTTDSNVPVDMRIVFSEALLSLKECLREIYLARKVPFDVDRAFQQAVVVYPLWVP